MNSSEPLVPLTPYEERLTAYLDGRLPAEDALAFEREHPEVVAQKARQNQFAGTLRAHSTSPRLRNGEFFNHQILRQVEPAAAPAKAPRTVFPLWRLVFASAVCLLAAVGIYKSISPTPTPQREDPVPKYMAQVTRVQAGDYLLKAKLVDVDGLQIVWVDGMDELPKDYVLQ
jgi:anti-sigma factor RsiW